MNAWIQEYEISDHILSSHVCPHSIRFLPGTSAPKSGQHITKYPLYKYKLCYILPLLGKKWRPRHCHTKLCQKWISVNIQINYISSSYRKHTLLQCDANPKPALTYLQNKLYQSIYNKNLKEPIHCNSIIIYHPS